MLKGRPDPYYVSNSIIFVDPLGLSFLSDVTNNFIQTNTELPGILAPTGVGFITGGAVAEAAQGATILQGIISGTIFSAEGALVVAGTSALNFSIAGLVYEGGVLAGSIISAIPTADGNTIRGETTDLIEFLFPITEKPSLTCK